MCFQVVARSYMPEINGHICLTLRDVPHLVVCAGALPGGSQQEAGDTDQRVLWKENSNWLQRLLQVLCHHQWSPSSGTAHILQYSNGGSVHTFMCMLPFFFFFQQLSISLRLLKTPLSASVTHLFCDTFAALDAVWVMFITTDKATAKTMTMTISAKCKFWVKTKEARDQLWKSHEPWLWTPHWQL